MPSSYTFNYKPQIPKETSTSKLCPSTRISGRIKPQLADYIFTYVLISFGDGLVTVFNLFFDT